MRALWALATGTLLLLGGCQTAKDYTEFRKYQPRSILVLPPLNKSVDVAGTYGVYASVTKPIAEMGYYVFPVTEVDLFLKENGVPNPEEMHQVSLAKFREIFGADAVLYLTVKSYGTRFILISSITSVVVEGKLVDTQTGINLWEGVGIAIEDSSLGSGNLVADAVGAIISQAINQSMDLAHSVAREANTLMLMNPKTGLLAGPYHAEFGN